MARISYDGDTAQAFKQVRELPRDGLGEWRDAVRRHLQPAPGITLVDIGAGTGAFSAAFADWFGIDVLAVEPSADMRDRIPRTTAIRTFAGDAGSLPLADDSADAAWLSLVIHHIPDLDAAAQDIRRVLRPGAPVLIRQGFRDRYRPHGELGLDSIEMVRWFPDTVRVIDTFPTLESTLAAFATAGFTQVALEQVRETSPYSLAKFLAQVDTFRRADTTLRALTDEEFLRGKQRLRDAVERGDGSGHDRSNWLDLLVLR